MLDTGQLLSDICMIQATCKQETTASYRLPTKRKNVENGIPSSSEGQGKYIYLSFFWPPLEAALSMNVRFPVKYIFFF